MKKIVIVLLCAFAVAFTGPAMAKKKGNTIYDADVTPDVIFGDGNDNGGFTIVRKKGVEVALRAKQRFPTPDNVFNSNGDGTYSFPAVDACPGFGFAPFPLCLTTPVWSFEWSVNTDFDDSTGLKVSDFIYTLKLDADPGKKTRFTEFDNISPSLIAPGWDHALGDNFTGNGDGTSAYDPILKVVIPSVYIDLYENNNVVQNSWNYEFFNNLGTTLEHFDPVVDGIYDIALEVRDAEKGRKYAEVVIQVIVGNP